MKTTEIYVEYLNNIKKVMNRIQKEWLKELIGADESKVDAYIDMVKHDPVKAAMFEPVLKYLMTYYESVAEDGDKLMIISVKWLDFFIMCAKSNGEFGHKFRSTMLSFKKQTYFAEDTLESRLMSL